jgi:glutamyl-tRNA reductase
MAELERTLAGKLRHLPEGDRAALTQMVDSATNKLLHGPMTHLREAGTDGLDAVSAVKRLFDLEDERGSSSGDATQKDRGEGEGDPQGSGGARGEGLPH